MSTFSSALNSFLTAAAGDNALLTAAGNLFSGLSTQVSSSTAAVGQAKALMQSIQLAIATGNTALVTSLATSILTTAGMPADIQAMAQLLIEKAATPQAGQFANLLQTTINNEAQSNTSILNTLAGAQTKLTGG
jgi:hypothetical protein